MDHGKLFKVLVIGGALLGLGCESDTAPRPSGEDAGEAAADGSTRAPAEDGGGAVEVADASPAAVDASPAADATAPARDAGGALETCGFCPNDCCVDDGMGGSKARDGFECCWGTSC